MRLPWVCDGGCGGQARLAVERRSVQGELTGWLVGPRVATQRIIAWDMSVWVRESPGGRGANTVSVDVQKSSHR